MKMLLKIALNSPNHDQNIILEEGLKNKFILKKFFFKKKI